MSLKAVMDEPQPAVQSAADDTVPADDHVKAKWPELAKIYGEEKDASFVNGLLGSVARAQDASDKDSE